ncbi:MAG: Gfo/Idh/MocA family protein [Spirochaetales bacterium]
MSSSRYFWNNSNEDSEINSEARAPAANAPVRTAYVGVGVMGRPSLEHVLGLAEAEVVAICEVDATRLEDAVELVREHSGTMPRRFRDYRNLCDDPDIDAVFVNTPDHWHVEIAVCAMEHGKDVYVEKPLSLTIAGGRRLADVAARTKRIVQTGSQQRSSSEFRRACELVRNGVIGTINSVEVKLPPNNIEPPPSVAPEEVPAEFDHDLWLGPAAWREYNSALAHYNFRFMSAHSGGQMTNWGAHHLDIVQWALGMDDSGPIEVEGTGTFHKHGPFDTATSVDLTYRYAGGVTVSCKTDHDENGVTFHGERGTISVGRGRLQAEPVSLLDWRPSEDDVRLYRSDNHFRNFFACVRSREQSVAPAEVGHRSATVCHLGNIAIRLGRKLRWDPQHEQFIDDPEANRLRDRDVRPIPPRRPETK